MNAVHTLAAVALDPRVRLYLVDGTPPIDLGPSVGAMKALIGAYLATPLGWLSIAIALWLLGRFVSFVVLLFTAPGRKENR
jgi:hypothetical protein